MARVVWGSWKATMAGLSHIMLEMDWIKHLKTSLKLRSLFPDDQKLREGCWAVCQSLLTEWPRLWRLQRRNTGDTSGSRSLSLSLAFYFVHFLFFWFLRFLVYHNNALLIRKYSDFLDQFFWKGGGGGEVAPFPKKIDHLTIFSFRGATHGQKGPVASISYIFGKLMH